MKIGRIVVVGVTFVVLGVIGSSCVSSESSEPAPESTRIGDNKLNDEDTLTSPVLADDQQDFADERACYGLNHSCSTNSACCSGSCVSYRCKAPTCTPSCSGKTCGPDGCGGTCGTCGSGTTCSGSTCVPAGTCQPDGTSCSSSGQCCTGNCERNRCCALGTC